MSGIPKPRLRAARYAAVCRWRSPPLAVALSACGSSSTSSSGSSTSAAQTGTPQRGGTLIVTFQGEPQTLDPAIDFEGNGWAIEHAIFGNLLNYAVRRAPPAPKIVADMATEVPTVANGGITNGGKTYIFHIRPGIKFAPPVNRVCTAQDFVYSFQRMMSLPTAPAKGYYTGIVGLQAFSNGKAKTITGYKATGKYTLEVDLQKPIATFLNIMEMPFSAPVAKEWVAKWGKQVGRHPLGTGPYVCDHWTPSQDLLLVRNTNYTGTTAGYLDAIHFEFSITPTTAVLKVQNGDADLLGDYIPPSSFPSLTYKRNVEEPGGGRAGHRARLPVLQRDRQAVRQPRRAPGALVGDRPRQDRQAALGHRPAAQPDLPGRPARPRRRSRRQLLRLRPGQGQAAAGRGRLPERLLHDPLFAQRRALADGDPVDPVRPLPDRRQGEHQTARPSRRTGRSSARRAPSVSA